MVQRRNASLQRVHQQVEEVLRVVCMSRDQVAALLRLGRHLQHVASDAEADRIAALANAVGRNASLLL